MQLRQPYERALTLQAVGYNERSPGGGRKEAAVSRAAVRTLLPVNSLGAHQLGVKADDRAAEGGLETPT